MLWLSLPRVTFEIQLPRLKRVAIAGVSKKKHICSVQEIKNCALVVELTAKPLMGIASCKLTNVECWGRVVEQACAITVLT